MSKMLIVGLVMLAPAFVPSLVRDAQAQSVGVRAGASADPDQFYVGMHADTPPIADRVSFRPNVEVGFGRRLTVVAVNLEFVYRHPINQSSWNVLVGAGPAAVVSVFDGHRGRNDSEVGGGLNFLAGIEHRGGFFAELKIGALDSPEVKFGVGYSFGR